MSIEIWQAEPSRSEISFTLRHLVVAAIEGQARQWQATLRIDPDDPTRSSVEARIEAHSIDTALPERDDHIRSAEFLDVRVHPEIRFRSTSVAPDGPALYIVKGDLTVGGVTREVTIDVEDLGRSTGPDGSRHATFRGHTTFNRQAFGLHWNQDLDSGGVVLGDKVDVKIAMDARKVTAISPRVNTPAIAR